MPKIHSEPLVTTYCTFLVFCRNIAYLLMLVFPYIHKLCCLLKPKRAVLPQKLRGGRGYHSTQGWSPPGREPSHPQRRATPGLRTPATEPRREGLCHNLHHHAPLHQDALEHPQTVANATEHLPTRPHTDSDPPQTAVPQRNAPLQRGGRS